MSALELRWRWIGPTPELFALGQTEPLSPLAAFVGAPGSQVQSVGVGFTGPFKPSEGLPGFIHVGTVTYTVEASVCIVDVAPTSAVAFTITKNRVAWAYVTIQAGQITGVFSFVTDGQVESGDFISFLAPPSTDPTLQGFYATLGSD